MEWILILIFVNPLGTNQIVTTSITGIRSQQACLTTLERVKKEAETTFNLSPLAVQESFKRSLCVEKAK